VLAKKPLLLGGLEMAFAPVRPPRSFKWLGTLLIGCVLAATVGSTAASPPPPAQGAPLAETVGSDTSAPPAQAQPAPRSAPATVCQNPIYDNGTFINGIDNGAGGADTSILYNISKGETILGFGTNAAAGIMVSDEFTLTMAAEPTQLTFYTYQTGSTQTSTITGIRNVAIYNGPPGAGGVLISGPVTPTLTSSDWTGVFRVSEDAPMGSTRPIMNVTANWPFGSLQPGTYWLQWSLLGSLASGPWTPPIKSTGNARQFTPTAGAWTAAVDGTAGRELPFTICGTTSNPTTITSAAPASGVYGTAYQHTFTATGTPTPTLSLSGTLPPGLTWNAANGILGGTPTQAGSFPLTLTADNGGGSQATADYTLVIARAPLTVTAVNASRPAGQANPAFTVSYSGFVLGDTASVLDTAPVAASAATPASPPGQYPITVSGGSDDNYAFTYVAGTLTITDGSSTIRVYLPQIVRSSAP
jgi:hypothetical protein